MSMTGKEVGARRVKLEIFEHPPNNPDLAPSTYCLFLHLKKFLAAQSLKSDQENKELCRAG